MEPYEMTDREKRILFSPLSSENTGIQGTRRNYCMVSDCWNAQACTFFFQKILDRRDASQDTDIRCRHVKHGSIRIGKEGDDVPVACAVLEILEGNNLCIVPVVRKHV